MSPETILIAAAVTAVIGFLVLRPWRRLQQVGVASVQEILPETLSYERSCRKLQELGLLEQGPIPPLPAAPPQADDEVLGISFFRTSIENVSLDSLSLPRTYFSRSLVENASFRGSDLTESTLCWNDFVRVDFSQASLRAADLRASNFDQVSFSRCDLSASDLRQSTFKACDFTDAKLAGAKLTKAAAPDLRLTAAQCSEIDWQSTEGEEPAGG